MSTKSTKFDFLGTNRNRNSRVQPAAENDDIETDEKQPRVAAYLRPKPIPVKKTVQPPKSVEKPSQPVVRHHVHELKRPDSEEVRNLKR